MVGWSVGSGAFLSMSSTAVVLKCLMDSNMGNTEHGQVGGWALIRDALLLMRVMRVMPLMPVVVSNEITVMA